MFSHTESLTNIHKLLLKTAERHELALDEPIPYFKVLGFYENFIEVQFSVWSSTEDFFEFNTHFPKSIHRAIKNSGIKQPYQKIKILESFSQGSEKS